MKTISCLLTDAEIKQSHLVFGMGVAEILARYGFETESFVRPELAGTIEVTHFSDGSTLYTQTIEG